MKRTLLTLCLVVSLPTFAGPKEEAVSSLRAAETALARGDEKEAGRQLKLYHKAMQRLRFERRLKKAAEELKNVDLPTLKDV